jgi:hypothetical protein
MIPENEDTHLRLFEYNPSLKLIYLMRDPIGRMISHYGHNFVRKRISLPLEEELRTNNAYVTRSSYYTQIKPYIDTFGRDNVKLLIFEEFIKNPKETLLDVASFIGIDEQYFKEMEDFSRKNQTANRKILADGGIGKVFKPIKRIRRYLPEGVVSAGLKLFGNSIAENPTFPDELKHDLYQKVKPEVESLESLMGKEMTLWKQY